MNIALIWNQWGPYHYARFQGLIDQNGIDNSFGLSFSDASNVYAWKSAHNFGSSNFKVLNSDVAAEKLNPFILGIQVYKWITANRIDVALIPSYWPATSFACLLAAKLSGANCVMMNESHARTEQAKGLKRLIKRGILQLFDAALLGGNPQIDHFLDLGMDEKSLFDGYDVVDNDYFGRESDSCRDEIDSRRYYLGLPRRFILSLGRMVEKKNLETLIRAYARASPSVALVMVGGGPLEAELMNLAQALDLRVRRINKNTNQAEDSRTVYFGGFQDVKDSPSFYALSEAFVLPSHTEEWGLVVNEAMACGCPVIVSDAVGCSSNLVIDGVNGFKFPPDNIEFLSNIISRITVDANLRREMGYQSQVMIKEWSCERFGKNALRACELAYNKD